MTNDFEIDLRKYINWVLHSWIWIASLAMIGAAGGLILSLLNPHQYRATAVVVVTREMDSLNFGPKIDSNDVLPTYLAYYDLAESDHLKYQVYMQLNEEERDFIGFNLFRDQISAVSAGSDQSVINFTITLEDPDLAAQLANDWAEAFVIEANQLFSGETDTQLVFYQDQLKAATQTQLEKDNFLADFQKTNEFTLLSNKLISKLKMQEELLALQRSGEILEEGVNNLLQKIQAKPAGSTISQSEEISALLMLLQTYNYQMNGSSFEISSGTDTEESFLPAYTARNSSQIPLYQITIDLAELTTSSKEDTITSLEQISDAIVFRQQWVGEYLAAIEPDILALQQKIQAFQDEQFRLIQEQTIARETTNALALKVQEVQIALQSVNSEGPVMVASAALTPNKPISRNTILNAGIAGAAGLAVGILGVFVKNWWQEGQPPKVLSKTGPDSAANL
jgi:uncharacterized protein involved in exopolysaccharide biosynthesis